MRKLRYDINLPITALIIISFLSCKDSVAGSISDFFQDNPTHITWTDVQEDIEGYRADVDVFAMNSRTDIGAELVDSYTMSMKNINGRMYTRIDTVDSDLNNSMRSFVTDGTEIVIFNPNTNVVDFRMPVLNPPPQELEYFSNEGMLSKINLSEVRSEAYRLSFNIIDNSSSGSLILELPTRLFPENFGENRISTRVVYDTVNELLNHTEVITFLNDGTRRIASSYPIYQEFNGTFIKTGTLHIIDYVAPNHFIGIQGGKIYNSPDDYPTMSQQEYARLSKEGRAFPAGDMFFGDPANPSYTETIIEVYRNVEINTVPNSYFRILGDF